MSQTPSLTPLSLSQLCAQYLKIQFRNKLNARSPCGSEMPGGGQGTLPAQPLMLPVALASELDIIADTLEIAFFNRSQ